MINDFKVASKSLLELLFPTLCISCKKYGKLICTECYDSIHINEEPFYIYCGQKVLCAADYEQRIVLKTITSFKYPFIKNLDIYCAQVIYDYLRMHKIQFAKDTIITFVPMHYRKESLRGFNQTELIAERLSCLLGLLCTSLLTKTRHTKAQMLLNRPERKQNLKGSFSAVDCSGRDIILIDDVTTTGSTLKECSQVLYASGAMSVTCITFCKD